MQRTKSKILSILLSLVMLLSLLPTTALAATYNDVKVNGVSLGDGEYLTSNAATAASISSTEPTTYVAWYKNGVLTLNNFTGKSNSGIVLQGAPAADLIIKLIGNNTITPYDTGIQGNSAAGSITITADSGSNGKLTINMPNSERSAFGINGSANSVTISGSADVTIIATATATNQESYGIKSSKAVSILDSASVSITCKTPNSSSRSDSCNGIYSDTGVTINTDGTIQIDVREAGDEAYSYGINSMGTLTLTKVGGMTVKWKKAGVQGSPLLPSSASFDPNAYDTHMDTTDTTNCTATYMPKGTATITSVSATVSQPVKGYPLDTSVNVYGATAYTAEVMWKDVEENMTATGDAKPGKIYTALITLTAKEGEAFSSSLNNTTTSGGYSIEWLNSTELLLSKTFDRTNLKETTGIAIDNTTLTVAVPKAEPNMEQKAELPLTAKVIYDDGTDETVDVTWSIVPDPKPEGVDIEADGKLTVTNKAADGTVEVKAAYNGMIDKKTVTITKDTPVESAIVLTAPASTTVAVPKSDTPNEIDLPTATVYDQYGKPMTGTFSITYESVGGAPTGVTLDTGAGKMKVKRTAQAGEVEVVGKLITTAGTVTSDPVAYTITRETSKVTYVLVSKLYHNMPVPEVTEPGGTNSADQQFTAEVLDQYLQEMTGQTVTWRVTDTAGKPVHGVSIDNTGKLTVTNEAPGIKVYAIATCQGVDSNNLDMTLHRDTAKDTFVKICNQVGDAPETSILIPTGSIPRSEDYTAKVYDQYGKETAGMVFWKLDKTYTGVELDTTSIPGSATLKVYNTATPGTIQLIATCSTVGSTASKTLDITLVDKTPASVTAVPAAQTGLFYNGTDQALVTAGTASGGTMQYSLDGTTWSTAVPTGKNVGAYTVQYKVVGDATHTDTAPEKCQLVTISPKFLTMDNLTPTGSTSKVYDGTTNSSITVGVKAGVLFGSDTLTITGTAVYNSANVNEANTITFTPDAITGNYELVPGVLTIPGASITPRDLTVTPNGGQSKKFGAADPTLHSTNSGRVTGQIPDFTGALSRAEGEDVGQYDITLGTLALIDHFSSGFKASNYTLKMVSPAVKFEITKADAPAAPTGLKGYKDSALSTVTLPTGWSWVDGTLKMNTIGDQTFKANYAGDTNHQAGTNVDVTVKVVRRSSSGGGGSYYAPVVPDMPMVYWGCTGDAVKTLQEKLNAKGFHSGNADGIFGAKTYAAVTAFQKANSLGVDGIVGKLTWAKLYDATPVNVTPVTTQPMLRTGSRGDAVRKLQELLNAKGYTCGSVDGIFGSKTYAAVLAFQKANGLAADGIVGSLTWGKLV